MVGANCSIFGYSGSRKKIVAVILEVSQKEKDEWDSKWRK